MTANRVATLAGILTAVGAFLATLLGAFENEYVRGAVAVTALLVAAFVVTKYMEGSQNYDSLVLSGAPKVAGVTVPPPNAAADDDTVAVEYENSAPTDEEVIAAAAEQERQDEERLKGFGSQRPSRDLP